MKHAHWSHSMVPMMWKFPTSTMVSHGFWGFNIAILYSNPINPRLKRHLQPGAQMMNGATWAPCQNGRAAMKGGPVQAIHEPWMGNCCGQNMHAYLPVIKHGNGKPSFIDDCSIHRGFSIAMFVYRKVIHLYPMYSICKCFWLQFFSDAESTCTYGIMWLRVHVKYQDNKTFSKA